MRNIIALFILAIQAQAVADDGWSKRWTAAGDSWEERWSNTLAEVDGLPREQQLEVLGRAVKLGYKTDLQSPNETQMKFSNEAVAKITAIPGHAEYFGNQITIPYAAIKQAYADGKKTGMIGWSHFLTDSTNTFKTLSMIPSHETVRVLGDMLSDDWKWPGYEKDKLHGTLDTRALSKLSKLPIANPPTRQLLTDADMREYLEDWKQWYAEIESGRRTFRFIGDDTEYDLRGPVRRGGSVERNRGQKRPLSEGEPESQAAGRENKPFRFLPYAIALLFLAAGLWSLIRKNKRNPNAVSR